MPTSNRFTLRTALVLTAFLTTPALSWAQGQCVADAGTVVEAAYRQVLEHPSNGDGAELTSQLASGRMTVRDVVRELAKSSDHRQRFLRTSNGPGGRDAAITNLYRHLLGRQPDAEGLRTHVAGFANGNSDPVIDSLIESQEYRMAFGDDTVPGSRVRYCGRQTNTRNDGRNGNNDGRNNNGNGNGNNGNGNGNGDSRAIPRGDVRTDSRGGSRGDDRDRGGLDDQDFAPGRAPMWTAENFRRIDRNRDGRLTANEWIYDAEFFRRADRDRDGTLVFDEFTRTIDDGRDVRFEDLDRNRNGRLERNEWKGSVESFRWLDRNNDNVLSRVEVVGDSDSRFDSFNGLDVNRSGTINVQEWRWSRRSFAQYDLNRDGELSRREFAAGGGSPSVNR